LQSFQFFPTFSPITHHSSLSLGKIFVKAKGLCYGIRMESSEKSLGTLYIVSTPIGNLEDITLRALRIIKEVDLIAAEDTRRTRQLLSHYNIRKPLLSYHEHNRRAREELLIAELREGRDVALVTDAGTPGISDPGEHLVARAVQESFPLVPIPGPSALVAALSISGLSTENFIFYGFLPSKTSGRQKLLFSLRERPETLIFYESPKRLYSLLEEALQILGERRVAVAREMTKMYEEVYRGTLSEVLGLLGEEEVKGEITLLIEGAMSSPKEESISIREALELYQEDGLSMKEAIERVARELEVSKRDVYQESLQLKKRPKKPARS